jgi:hypothetical protein
VAWNDNGTVQSMNVRGIFLSHGIDGFQIGQPAPELLRKIGPALLAAGTEEIRVFFIAQEGSKADPVERAASPERTIKTRQFIRGREVLLSSVNISLNIKTNELTVVVANFLPDRGLDHEPRLTAAQARAKAEARIRKDPYAELRWGGVKELTFVNAPAPHLAYEFEEVSGSGGIGGELVWIFSAQDADNRRWYQVSASSATGKVLRLRTHF